MKKDSNKRRENNNIPLHGVTPKSPLAAIGLIIWRLFSRCNNDSNKKNKGLK